MTITEATRYRLHQRLEAVLGPEEANVLMEHLAPVGWADVATKADLDAGLAQLRADVRLDLARMENKLLWGLLGVIGANTALVVAAFGAGRLL